MFVITVSRKPIAEGGVAPNVLAHGCGALQIDACRVGAGGQLLWSASRGMGYHGGTDVGSVAAVPSSKGRWPTNLILSHLPECRELGLHSVKSRSNYPGARPKGSQVAGLSGHAGQEGLVPLAIKSEVVPEWACASGCPVERLDAQSGSLKSGTGAVKRASAEGNRGNRGAAYGAESRPEGQPMLCYGDEGGASRFFKQVQMKIPGEVE